MIDFTRYNEACQAAAQQLINVIVDPLNAEIEKLKADLADAKRWHKAPPDVYEEIDRLRAELAAAKKRNPAIPEPPLTVSDTERAERSKAPLKEAAKPVAPASKAWTPDYKAKTETPPTKAPSAKK